MTLTISIEQIIVTAIEDQYCRIRMVDIIKVNIQQVHGPTIIKLAHCFCLAVLFINFPLSQDFIKYLCQQICIGGTTIQQCKHCNFFKGARMLVNINVFFCFTGTAASICVNTLVRHCNVNELNATSASL